MKRSQLQRRTGLKPGKPLKRAELQPVSDKRRQQLPPWCRSTLNSVSKSRQRQNRVRSKAMGVLRETAGDWCACCGSPYVPTFGHERLSRSQGGDPTRPDMPTCNPCNQSFEDHPRRAAWQGWKISRKHPTAPCIASGQCRYGAHGLGEQCERAA